MCIRCGLIAPRVLGDTSRGPLCVIMGFESPAAALRDDEFWLADGSIILVTPDAQFRVYKEILAEHSCVFRDMLSLPQDYTLPLRPNTLVCAVGIDAECPVVHLSDSAREICDARNLTVSTPAILVSDR